MLLKDVRSLPAREGGRRRTVVVGSGAAGLFIANELVKQGHDVVVIESGGVNLGSFEASEFATVGRRHDGIRIGRSRSLGGTTNLWGGQLVEFQAADFAPREGLSESRWPIRYEEIQPYYAKAYESLGIPSAAQADAPVIRHFLRAEPRFEDGLELFLTRWMKSPSFAVHYQSALRGPRLPLLLDHTVTGFTTEGPAVRAVRVIGPTGAIEHVEGDRFVLACGTIETSRLLLHAATGERCPWASNPNLGARFQDHLGGPIASVIPIDRRRLDEMFCTMVWSGHKFQPKIRMSESARTKENGLSVHGMFLYESSVSENLVYLKQFLKAALFSRRISNVRDLFTNLRACGRYLVPLMWKYVVDNRVFVPSTAKIALIAQSEQVPLRQSRITLDPSSTASRGLPRAVLDWRLRGDEVGALRDFALRCDRALRAAGLARLEIPERLSASHPAFLDTLRDTNHQAGGACMAESEAEGVVDRDLRVFGTENLYVAGAATFPTSSGANTTFTALAFGARLVDHLSERHALD